MHHVAKITFGKVKNRPYHGECACGTAGDFASNEETRNYLAMHISRLQGINSADFIDDTVAPLEVPQEEPAEVAEQAKPADEGKKKKKKEVASEKKAE